MCWYKIALVKWKKHLWCLRHNKIKKEQIYKESFLYGQKI